MKYSKAVDIFEKHLQGQSFKSSPKELYEPIDYCMQIGGKRLRPALLLMAGCMFQKKVKNFLNAAMGVEIFHNFTLVHDDIMDNAPLRRGKATVHKQWNRDIAILSGDVMFVTACQYMCMCKPKHLIPLLEIFHETAIQVCEGQQMDMNFEKQQKVSIKEYLHMIELKTAVLLACSLKLGAIIGGAGRDDAENLYNFGKHIGVAFQLQDDILDAFSDGKQFGKLIGGDIIANKKTFLYLAAMDMADMDTKEKLNAAMQIQEHEKKVEQVLKIFEQLNIREFAEKKMKYCFKRGMNFLKSVDLPEERKKDLKELAEQLMYRMS